MIYEIQNAYGDFVDITDYIAYNGLEYQLSDVDSPNAGRAMNGRMYRGKITDKDKWKLKFRPLKTSEVSLILQLVSNEYIQVRYLSPRYNGVVIKTMYVGDRTASHCIERADGTILWKDLAFSNIEV